jgi:tetratricopeptide (TPR) repeat protein
VRAAIVIGSAVVLALTASPARAEREWNEATAGGIRIVSAMNAAQTEKIAADVELYFEAAKRFIDRPDLRPNVPVTLIALNRSLWRRYVDPTGRFGGLFQNQRGSADIVVDASVWSHDSHIVFHELTHLVQAQGEPARSLPTWYKEGYAELLSTLEFKGGLLKFGLYVPHNWEVLQDLPWMPLEKVLTTRLADVHGRNDVAMFYGQCWLIIHHSIFESQARREQLHRYRQLLAADLEPQAALQSAFGSQLEAYEKELQLYGKRPKYAYVALPVESLNVPKPKVRRLPEAEGLNTLGRWLLIRNESSEREVEFFRGLAKSAPAESVAALQYANALIRVGDVAAATPMVEAGCVEPREMQIAVLCGHAYRRLALVADARKFYDVALQLEPDNLEILLTAADTFKPLPGDSAVVRRGLESALQRHPNNSDIAAGLSDLYRSIDLLKARDYMERAMLNAPSEKREALYAQELNRIGSELAAQ